MMPKLSREGLQNALASYNAARERGTLGDAISDAEIDALAPRKVRRQPEPTVPAAAQRQPLGPVETGMVKVYDHRRGFGFIVRDAGPADAFLHAKSLQMSGIDEVAPGDRLTFRTATDNRGVQAYEPHRIDDAAPQSADAPRRGPRAGVAGRLMYFDDFAGSGMLSCADGGDDVRVTVAAIEASRDFTFLNTGDRLTFDVAFDGARREVAVNLRRPK